jgi:octopine/nopaline transport system permease protein
MQAYTGVIRGVPELLIILLMYFGGTALMSAVVGRYIEINAFAAGVTALTVVFSGYAAEIFRGAINAVAPGQREAAMALGLSRWQIWPLIIIPQMIPIALPAFCNLCISLIKDTSLISVVGLTDVMRVAYIGAGSLRAPLPFYLAASAIYLTLTSLSLLSFRLIEVDTLSLWRKVEAMNTAIALDALVTLPRGLILTLALTSASLAAGFVISIPLAFILGWLGSVTSKDPVSPKAVAMEVRSFTGIGAEKATGH